ncbi:BclA C-terminal domain-containing protein [Runella sp.]|uniref:BclA C-terminal domain-containing protein n=1 Tax=Runella sp. TaxID=1960881 RepID=UPI003D0FA458
MKRRLLLFFVLAFSSFALTAQVGIGTNLPDNSAQLEVQSTSKGFLPPRMSLQQRTGIAAAEGLLVYQTEAPVGYYYFTQGAWQKLANLTEITNALPPAVSGFAANNTGNNIDLKILGVLVPLPDAKNLSGIIANADNTEFTVSAAGRYNISYTVNTRIAQSFNARILVNGATAQGTVVTPSIVSNILQSNAILTLPANAVISLQFYGSVANALLNNNSGATLTIIRLP